MGAVPGNSSSESGVNYLTLLQEQTALGTCSCRKADLENALLWISPPIFHILVDIKSALLTLGSLGVFGYLRGVALVAQFLL